MAVDGPGWLWGDGGCERRGFLHVRERVLAGWSTSLLATGSRGELDFGSLSLISSLFMCLILIGFRSSLVCIFNNLLSVD